jgi:hypothetical protein
LLELTFLTPNLEVQPVLYRSNSSGGAMPGLGTKPRMAHIQVFYLIIDITLFTSSTAADRDGAAPAGRIFLGGV